MRVHLTPRPSYFMGSCNWDGVFRGKGIYSITRLPCWKVKQGVVMAHKLIVPETINELLDLCATIVRNTGGRYSAGTMSELFPAGNRNPFRWLAVFDNAGDMPFSIWLDGAANAIVSELLKERSERLYAYRRLVHGKIEEVILRYPVWDTKHEHLYWLSTDTEFYPNHLYTQFLDA